MTPAPLTSATVPADAVPPSGEQVRLVHGEHEVVTVALAAGLRSYAVGGRALLDGFGEHERPNGGRGQTLVPWPNRIAGGRYELDGATQQLALTEPAKGNAIHGLARWVLWTAVERTASSVTWQHVVPPQPGWPTSLVCRVTYGLADDGLTVTTSARNVGAAACLYGTGAHPYLTAGTERVDHAVLEVPAGRWYETDERGIPMAVHQVDGGDVDLRQPQPIGSRVLDTAYTDLTRDPDGRWRVRLSHPDGGGAVLWADETYRWAQVFTGDTLPESHRRRGVAVEPTTCPPDAFNADDPEAAGVVRLGPGEQHVGQWGIAPL